MLVISLSILSYSIINQVHSETWLATLQYHPDYAMPWYLYVYASDIALGGVLIQVTNQGTQQVVAFISKKFSAVALLTKLLFKT